jgi:hypothetical protein
MLGVLNSEFGYTNKEVKLFIDTAKKWVNLNDLDRVKSDLDLPQNIEDLNTFLNSITQKVDYFR